MTAAEIRFFFPASFGNPSPRIQEDDRSSSLSRSRKSRDRREKNSRPISLR